MFNKDEKQTEGEVEVEVEVDTIIGGSTQIEGNIRFSGKLHIDGEVVGDVVADKDGSILTISKRGRIEGNVQVHRILLNGEVVGDVYAINDIELASDARVRGNLYYEEIEMSRGSEVNGKMIHGTPAPVEGTFPAAETAPVESVSSSPSLIENPAELSKDMERQMHQQPKIKAS